MKAMAKVPAQRYANARELLEDLCRVQAGARSSQPAPVVSLWEERKIKRWSVAALVVVAIVAASFAIYRWTQSTPVLTERGWVLISDFETSGKQPIPDKAVREGLTIALQQSRYVNVFPRTRAYEVLQRMKKEPATRIDEALGREICQRENLQVLLAGSIEHIGQVFQITVQALDPVQGNLLFADRERLDREDQFFEKADALAKKVRKHLGESLDHIEKSSRPLARVTTSSLQALQFYSRAKDAKDQGKEEQVPDLLKGALRVDPNFAMAHLRLGQYYLAVVGKNEKAFTEVKLAYQLRQGVTDREQRKIEAEYYNLQERYDDEAQSLNILVSLYPDDEEAHQALADAYYNLNQLDKAILELREVLRLNSSSAPGYRSLVLYLARSNQADAAVAASHEAQQRAVDSPQMHWGLGLAYLGEGDPAMARQEFHRIGHGTETDRELQELCLAIADLYEGKLGAAKAKLAKQILAAPEDGGLQTFRRYLLGRIHLNQGNWQQATVQADLILRVPSASLQTSDLLNAGILYARAGSINNARLVLHRIDDSQKAFPSSWNESCFQNLEGEIGLAGAKPAEAGDSFMAAAQEYPDFVSHIGLARAYHAQEHWNLAAHGWEQVLRDKGEILQNDFPPDLAYAHLQLARLYRQMNNRDLARSHYEELLRMWQHADALPLLRDAKREVQELNLESRPSKHTLGTDTTSPVAHTKSR
jgi:tetratricopeptide (TPR) repeat protein